MSETFDNVADFLRAQIHVDKGVALAALADWVSATPSCGSSRTARATTTSRIPLTDSRRAFSAC